MAGAEDEEEGVEMEDGAEEAAAAEDDEEVRLSSSVCKSQISMSGCAVPNHALDDLCAPQVGVDSTHLHG